MMNLICISTSEYPVSVDEFFRRFPNTCKPSSGSAPPTNFLSFGYDVVLTAPKPAANHVTHEVIEAAPTCVDGVYTQAWVVEPRSPADAETRLGEEKSALIVKIDQDTDNIYARVVGNRATEYLNAEVEAREFQSSGYLGDTPTSVQDVVTSASLTPQQAAEVILSKAAEWRAAQSAIRTKRINLKAQSAAAPSYEALELIKLEWTQFVIQMRSLT